MLNVGRSFYEEIQLKLSLHREGEDMFDLEFEFVRYAVLNLILFTMREDIQDKSNVIEII